MLNLKFTGISPFLMHSEAGLNRLNPLKREQAVLTKKRIKTDEDHEEILRLDFELAIYHNDELGPYISGHMIEAGIRQAAKLSKLGTTIQRSVMVVEDKIRLEYSGPRDIKKLWKDTRFTDVRGCRVGAAKVMRCRPKFDEWAISFHLEFDREAIDRDVLIGVCETGGRSIGLGDYRPRFGRYSVEVLA